MLEPTVPVYKIVPRGDRYHVVVVTPTGRELDCTQPTRDPALAQQWCNNLRRAASIEEDRKRQIRGLT